MPNHNSDAWKITDPNRQRVRHATTLTTHPGVFFRQVIMPQYGLNVSSLARLIDFSRPHLHNVLSGRGDLTRELAYRLGALFTEQVADFLINYQHLWDLQQEQPRRAALRQKIRRLPEPAPDDGGTPPR
ncbi:MAG: hypothetical protein KGM17_02960 [Sphingomonadales bacterium]|nr:hypothetical protein [Sphingomonadales bacterium]